MAEHSSSLRVDELGGALVQNPTSGYVYHISIRFALLPFPSPVLRESLLLSFPPGTKMLQFPGSPFQAAFLLPGMLLREQDFPFRHPGFKGCMRLPQAYRSLPRPSSARKPSHPPYSVLALGVLSMYTTCFIKRNSNGVHIFIYQIPQSLS